MYCCKIIIKVSIKHTVHRENKGEWFGMMYLLGVLGYVSIKRTVVKQSRKSLLNVPYMQKKLLEKLNLPYV